MEDEKIVELYWKREERAIGLTQEKYEKYLTKIAYQILADLEDSRESVNDTYLAAWNSIPPNRPKQLSTYLGKITRRTAIDICRKRHRQKRIPSEYEISLEELKDCISDKEGPEEKVNAKILAKTINSYLKTLPINSQNVFIGRYYFFDPIKEVARYCHISEGKARVMLFRIRCGLKEYLEKEGVWI